MSLSRLAIRLATVAALRGRTFAGDAVRDSEITPIDVARTDQKLPFIAVYADDGEFKPGDRDLFSNAGTFSLVIEIGVTARMRYKLEDGEIVDVDEVVPTDAVMEMTLDLIARQVGVALLDPENLWAEIWKKLVGTVSVVRSRRGASSDKGERFAGRQIEIVLTPLAEPPFGPEPTLSWTRFLDQLAAETDPDLASLAPVIRAQIVSSAPQPEWRTLQATLGLTRGEADAMLLTPADTLGDADITMVDVMSQPAQPLP